MAPGRARLLPSPMAPGSAGASPSREPRLPEGRQPPSAPGHPGRGEPPAMTARAIHWHEGMFLRPHHLQAAQRHLEQVSNTGDKWDLNYNWGLRRIAIDREALANHRLVIHSLQARLRDGTLIST